MSDISPLIIHSKYPANVAVGVLENAAATSAAIKMASTEVNVASSHLTIRDLVLASTIRHGSRSGLVKPRREASFGGSAMSGSCLVVTASVVDAIASKLRVIDSPIDSSTTRVHDLPTQHL